MPRPSELLEPSLSSADLLFRLFHEDGVRIYRQRPLRHNCRCSREKVERTLRAFPLAELETMVENGVLRVTCEFCKTDYVFDEPALNALGASLTRSRRDLWDQRQDENRALCSCSWHSLLAALAGCVRVPRGRCRSSTFAHSSPILLNVREAQIDPRYRSPGTPPQHRADGQADARGGAHQMGAATSALRRHREHRPLHHPERAAHRRAAAARALASLAPSASEPEQRWTVTVEAQLEILDESGNRLDGYTAKVTRTRDMPEGLTYEERNRFWYDLLSATMSEFDAQMATGHPPVRGAVAALIAERHLRKLSAEHPGPSLSPRCLVVHTAGSS